MSELMLKDQKDIESIQLHFRIKRNKLNRFAFYNYCQRWRETLGNSELQTYPSIRTLPAIDIPENRLNPN